MKILKATVLAALMLCGLDARANWTVIYPNAATVSPGESGSSTFEYTPDINGTISPGFTLNVVETSPTFQGWSSAGGSGNPISSFSIGSEPTTFTSGQQFQVVVDWTIASGLVSSPTAFYINFGLPTSDGTQTSSQNFNLTPSAVPEPNQIIAGSVILGFGILLYAGRRFVRKVQALQVPAI